MLKARGRAPADYDQVILACHSDQALALLRDPSTAEREVLGGISYQENDAVLHTDVRLLPRRRRAWAAWNYHRAPRTTVTGRVSVTYNLTRLQSLPTRREFLVTLNGDDAVDPRTILHRETYSHPVFDAASLRSQGRIGEISGVRRTWYCGAYWGYGFHEDGVRSAAAVCNALGQRGVPVGRSWPDPPRRAGSRRGTADAQLYLSGTR